MPLKRMKKLALFGVLAALAAACAGEPSPTPTPTISVGFADEATVARAGGQAIDVKAYNPRPLGRAELVGPDGGVIAAAPGQPEPQAPTAYPVLWPSIGVGVFGGSHSGVGTGVSIGVPLGGYGGGTVPPGGFVRSRALILVPDMARYRGTWERSVVRLTFGAAPGEVTVAEIPAPEPGGR